MATSKNQQKPDILINFDEVKYNNAVKDMQERAQAATILTAIIKREFNFNPSKEAILGVIGGDNGSSHMEDSTQIAEELKAAILNQLGSAGVGKLVSESVFEAGIKNLYKVISEHRQHYPWGVRANQYDFDGETWTVKESSLKEIKARLSNIVDSPVKHRIHEAHLEYVKAVQNVYDAISGASSAAKQGISSHDFARFMIGMIHAEKDNVFTPKHLNYNAFN